MRGARDVPEAGLVQVRDVDEDPEPVAGDDERAAGVGQARARCRARPGKRNGTPSPNAFGRDQTIPTERRPRSYQALEIGEVGRERVGALEVHDRRHPARARGRRRRRAIGTPSPSSTPASSSGDARAPRRAGSRRRAGASYGAAGGSGSSPAGRDVEREEPAAEVGLGRAREVDVPRRLAAPAPQRRGRCARRGSPRAHRTAGSAGRPLGRQSFASALPPDRATQRPSRTCGRAVTTIVLQAVTVSWAPGW